MIKGVAVCHAFVFAHSRRISPQPQAVTCQREVLFAKGHAHRHRRERTQAQHTGTCRYTFRPKNQRESRTAGMHAKMPTNNGSKKARFGEILIRFYTPEKNIRHVVKNTSHIF